LCPAGTYMALTGASACTNCTAGKYSAAVGATTVDTCSGCDAGKYSVSVGATTVDTCSGCDAGKTPASTRRRLDLQPATNALPARPQMPGAQARAIARAPRAPGPVATAPRNQARGATTVTPSTVMGAAAPAR
jgi:hypothetical protein